MNGMEERVKGTHPMQETLRLEELEGVRFVRTVMAVEAIPMLRADIDLPLRDGGSLSTSLAFAASGVCIIRLNFVLSV
jgi:hypothetical protein